MADRYVPIEELEVFERFYDLATWCWHTVTSWDRFRQDTLGKQLVRSADSVCANLVEGDARRSDKEGTQFFFIARASAREVRFWLKCCADRAIVDAQTIEERLAQLVSGAQMLNALIRYRRQKLDPTAKGIVREESATYGVQVIDPFLEDYRQFKHRKPKAKPRTPSFCHTSTNAKRNW